MARGGAQEDGGIGEMSAELETAVLEFIRDNPRKHQATQIGEAMRFRIELAVIDLLNKGKLEIRSDWTLEVIA